MPQFPSDPYEGQVFYDPESDTTYEFWIPRKDDEFCKKLNPCASIRFRSTSFKME